MATEAQIISNRPNAQKLTSTRSLSMSLGNPADCFMQNKANLLDDQMNLTSLITVDYENKSNWKLGENKPNTNPIKPNFRKAQMNLKSSVTKIVGEFSLIGYFLNRLSKVANPIKAPGSLPASNRLKYCNHGGQPHRLRSGRRLAPGRFPAIVRKVRPDRQGLLRRPSLSATYS